MSKVLILGGGGMLGHKLAQLFRGRFQLAVTFRRSIPKVARELFASAEVFENVEVSDLDAVTRVLAASRPSTIVNCVGVIKQLAAAKDPIPSLTINSLLPHRLHSLARAVGARLIHISTDCVFSGRRGMYTESDVSDAEDLYGRTKFLGETSGEGAITLRTSIIGRELATTSGLVEWFLSRRGTEVEGYARAIYTGLTTLELAAVVGRVIERHPELSGVYQVSSSPIAKDELLRLLDEAYGTNTTILSTSEVQIDRSLDGSRFRTASGWNPPPWRKMIGDMAADPTPYDEWRSS